MTLDREMRSALDAVNVDHLGERPVDYVRAMPSARAATPSGPSLLRVSGAAGISIAAICVLWFGGQLIRAVLS